MAWLESNGLDAKRSGEINGISGSPERRVVVDNIHPRVATRNGPAR